MKSKDLHRIECEDTAVRALSNGQVQQMVDVEHCLRSKSINSKIIERVSYCQMIENDVPIKYSSKHCFSNEQTKRISKIDFEQNVR